MLKNTLKHLDPNQDVYFGPYTMIVSKITKILETCPVPFCRKGYPILPDGAEVFRASGDCLCEGCGKPFRDHPHLAYPGGMGHAVRDCGGSYLHL